jgi:hypothetical protein
MWNTVKRGTETKCYPATKNNLVINPNQTADAFNYYFLKFVEK